MIRAEVNEIDRKLEKAETDLNWEAPSELVLDVYMVRWKAVRYCGGMLAKNTAGQNISFFRHSARISITPQTDKRILVSGRVPDAYHWYT